MNFRLCTHVSYGILNEEVYLTFLLTHFLLKITGWFRSKWNDSKNKQNSVKNPSEIDENLDIDSGNQNRKRLTNTKNHLTTMLCALNELESRIRTSKKEFYSLLQFI